MWLSNNPPYKRFDTKKNTSDRGLCECEALASLKHAYLGSLFLNPDDIRKLIIGVSWNFGKGTGLI
jgi:hypothetical protein